MVRKRFQVPCCVGDLRVYEFCQGAGELGCCVEMRGYSRVVDVGAYCVPEGGFETLCEVSVLDGRRAV